MRILKRVNTQHKYTKIDAEFWKLTAKHISQ